MVCPNSLNFTGPTSSTRSLVLWATPPVSVVSSSRRSCFAELKPRRLAYDAPYLSVRSDMRKDLSNSLLKAFTKVSLTLPPQLVPALSVNVPPFCVPGGQR